MPQRDRIRVERSGHYNHTLRILMSKNELESPELDLLLAKQVAKSLRQYRRVLVVADFVEEQEPPANRDWENDIQ